MSSLQKGFVHTVYFWLKEKDNAEHHAALHAGLMKLAENERISAAFVGTPADTSRPVIDSTYDFSITFIFKNKEDHDVYQVLPKHMEFIENCSQLWDKVQVYDAIS